MLGGDRPPVIAREFYESNSFGFWHFPEFPIHCVLVCVHDHYESVSFLSPLPILCGKVFAKQFVLSLCWCACSGNIFLAVSIALASLLIFRCICCTRQSFYTCEKRLPITRTSSTFPTFECLVLHALRIVSFVPWWWCQCPGVGMWRCGGPQCCEQIWT